MNTRPTTATGLAARRTALRMLDACLRTGQPLDKIERDTERDYYLSADESKEYGLVDQVIAKRP